MTKPALSTQQAYYDQRRGDFAGEPIVDGCADSAHRAKQTEVMGVQGEKARQSCWCFTKTGRYATETLHALDAGDGTETPGFSHKNVSREWALSAFCCQSK